MIEKFIHFQKGQKKMANLWQMISLINALNVTSEMVKPLFLQFQYLFYLLKLLFLLLFGAQICSVCSCVDFGPWFLVCVHRYVVIAMEALDQLLMACHSQSIKPFVESFLHMVAKLLESREPDLQVLGTNSVSLCECD